MSSAALLVLAASVEVVSSAGYCLQLGAVSIEGTVVLYRVECCLQVEGTMVLPSIGGTVVLSSIGGTVVLS